MASSRPSLIPLYRPSRNAGLPVVARCDCAAMLPILAVTAALSLGLGAHTVGDGLNPAVASPFNELVDPDTPPTTRRAAADALLDHGGGAARTALTAALAEGQPADTHRAVLQAIAERPDTPPAELRDPVYQMIGRVDDGLVSAWADAVGRFDEEKLWRQLDAVARDADADPGLRRRAVLALGRHRVKRTAERLIGLTANDQPLGVRMAAYSALRTMTGLEEFGDDPAAWSAWARETKDMRDSDWSRHVMQQLARRARLSGDAKRAVEQRLRESQRALYQTTLAEDRPKVLAYMLGDRLPMIRLLALDLAVQRLLDDEPFDATLRTALRERLSDPAPAIRQRAALLLRDIGDEPAAAWVGDRLAAGTEQEAGVLAAYLTVMARNPVPAAVPPALAMLGEERLRAEAAAALTAASEANLLTPAQTEDALRRLRRVLDAGDAVPPVAAVTLLGRIGEDQDWRRIGGWINSPDPALKRAAAQAWADSDRPLQDLAARVNDPVVGPVMLSAAAARGDDPDTLRALAANPPEGQAAGELWRRALAAMAGRVPTDTALTVIAQLEESGQPRDLQVAMLSAALNGNGNGNGGGGGGPPDRPQVLMLLRRAALHEQTGRPELAVADYARLTGETVELTAAQRRQRDLGMVRSSLAAGEYDRADTAARRTLAGAGGAAADRPSESPVVGAYLAAVQTRADAGEIDAAQDIVTRLRLLLGPEIKPELAQRIAGLEATLRTAAPPTTQPE